MGRVVQIEIPEEVILGMKIPEGELEEVIKVELALSLYQKGYLSLGQARKLAGLSKQDFINELSRRKIHRHYYREDLEDDIRFGCE